MQSIHELISEIVKEERNDDGTSDAMLKIYLLAKQLKTKAANEVCVRELNEEQTKG